MSSDTAYETTEETIFTWGAPPLKFGAGALDEVGFEMSQFNVKRVLIVTDSTINGTGIPQRIADLLAANGISSEIFDGVHVEPTDDSMDKAAGYAREQGPWDGFIAVGGGSAIDTAPPTILAVTPTDAARLQSDESPQVASAPSPPDGDARRAEPGGRRGHGRPRTHSRDPA